MKIKLIIKLSLVFLLFSGLFLNAQKYRAFDTTLTWHTVRSSVGATPGCKKDDSYNYYIKGYEINNSLYWHKVYANIILGYYAGASPTCAIQPTTTTAFVGYYNNDTINKKNLFCSIRKPDAQLYTYSF